VLEAGLGVGGRRKMYRKERVRKIGDVRTEAKARTEWERKKNGSDRQRKGRGSIRGGGRRWGNSFNLTIWLMCLFVLYICVADL